MLSRKVREQRCIQRKETAREQKKNEGKNRPIMTNRINYGTTCALKKAG
jgi:predicted transcriptional regulator